ncbi:MAG: dihydrolipoyllysine-residue acetyltransferase [Dokdonella sp.]|nr:dihydrolipoyllysine-residue acetyltransferase [Dokdonella sp.]
MSAPQEARVPDIGHFSNIPVIEVLVKVGDTVKRDQGLVTLESDKATMEVPAPFDGVVREVKVKLGDEVSEGAVVALIEAAAGEAADTPAPQAQPPAPAEAAAPAPPAPAAPKSPSAPKAAAPATAAAAPREQVAYAAEEMETHSPPVPFGAGTVAPGQVPYASPAVRLFARELGVDLARVRGSERKGRIVKQDVRDYVKSSLAMAGTARAGGAGGGLELLPWPSIDFSKFGEIEVVSRSRIKKISGANLARNWAMIPHVTQHDEADITSLEDLRVTLNKEIEKSGTRVTMLAFLVKAVVAGLKKFPEFNASLDADGDHLILKKYFHVGFAADTPNGLVVPVIREADTKGVIEIAAETAALAKQAREGKLGPADMSGGCFSISSLGGIGGTAFTPIVNAPEVAILGVSRASMKPVWNGEKFKPRLMLPLSLSYDHRVIDGAAAARFTVYLGEVLADMRRVLL